MEIITSHVNSDFDTIASMLAASKIYPDAYIVLPGAKEGSVNDFLLKSAIYAFKMKNAKEIDPEEVRRVILVDIRNSSRIGIFKDIVAREDVEVHIYDHHPEEEADIDAELEIIRPVGATTTILVEILRERGVGITSDEATVMMLGIYEDTGFLSYASTTPRDFKAATYLLEQGADLAIVRDILSRDMTAEQVYLLYDFINSSHVYTIHGVDVVLAEAKRETYIKDIAVVVHKLRDIESINVLFTICQMGDRILVIGRSRIKEVDTGAVLRSLGGGGHWYAASATVKALTTIQIREKILHLLSSEVIPKKRAEDLMAGPVKTVESTLTILEAHNILTRFNINSLPVKGRGKLSGIITRQIVEKALYHNLGDLPVADYMITDFETVTPEDDLDRVQDILIGSNQRILPVVAGGDLQGVITRTDLIRYLHDLREIAVGNEQKRGEHYYSRKKIITSLMQERLPKRILDLLTALGDTGDRCGMKVYVVGGFVRDLLLRQDNLDIDVVVEGDGIEFSEMIAKDISCRVRSHSKFGTAVVIFPDGFKIDVATARVEYYREPASLPVVEYSSIKHDLYRRDFTINTLAVGLNREHFGEVIDFFGGQRDLKDGIVRVLHNLSFVEDPTRILRAIRFEKRFYFQIGKNTLGLIRNAVKLGLLEKLPKPRIFADMELILKEGRVVEIMEEMSRLKLGKSIHPKLKLERSQMGLFRDMREVCVWFNLLYLDIPYEEWVCYLLALMDPLEADEAVAFAKEFGVRKKVMEVIRATKGEAGKVIYTFLTSQVVSKKGIYDLLKDLPIETILYMMSKAKSEDIRRYISMYFTRLRTVSVSIGGNELISMGLSPGPLFKTIFEDVHEKKLAGELKTREQEIRYVREKYVNGRSRKGT
jgi:tRNA nucleotidyltransferase (CCA-adding enzyme)